MILAILDVLVIFSGLPTGWKKIIILVVSVILVFIGWVMRAISMRRKAKILAAAQEIEHGAKIHEVAHVIARDIETEVEHDLHDLTGHRSHE